MERIIPIAMHEGGDKRSVMSPDCHMYVADHDTVTWHNYTDSPIKIHFDQKSNPIEQNDISVPAKFEGCPFGEAGPFKLNLKVVDGPVGRKPYFYELIPEARSSLIAADPVVIVH